jgi:hypothetical protein
MAEEGELCCVAADLRRGDAELCAGDGELEPELPGGDGELQGGDDSPCNGCSKVWLADAAAARGGDAVGWSGEIGEPQLAPVTGSDGQCPPLAPGLREALAPGLVPGERLCCSHGDSGEESGEIAGESCPACMPYSCWSTGDQLSSSLGDDTVGGAAGLERRRDVMLSSSNGDEGVGCGLASSRGVVLSSSRGEEGVSCAAGLWRGVAFCSRRGDEGVTGGGVNEACPTRTLACSGDTIHSRSATHLGDVASRPPGGECMGEPICI